MKKCGSPCFPQDLGKTILAAFLILLSWGPTPPFVLVLTTYSGGNRLKPCLLIWVHFQPTSLCLMSGEVEQVRNELNASGKFSYANSTNNPHSKKSKPRAVVLSRDPARGGASLFRCTHRRAHLGGLRALIGLGRTFRTLAFPMYPPSLLEKNTIAEVDRKCQMPPGRPWHSKASHGVTQVHGGGFSPGQPQEGQESPFIVWLVRIELILPF